MITTILHPEYTFNLLYLVFHLCNINLSFISITKKDIGKMLLRVLLSLKKKRIGCLTKQGYNMKHSYQVVVK